MVCTSNESAGLEQRAGASPVSIPQQVLRYDPPKWMCLQPVAANWDELTFEKGYILRMVGATCIWILETDQCIAQGLQICSMCILCTFHTAPSCKRVQRFTLWSKHWWFQTPSLSDYSSVVMHRGSYQTWNAGPGVPLKASKGMSLVVFAMPNTTAHYLHCGNYLAKEAK